MSKPVAAIIADTHVAAETIARVGSSGDAMCSVRQFVQAARRLGVKETIWLGDLNNKTANRSLVHSFWLEAMYELAAADIRVNFIQGNHDEDYPPFLLGFDKTRHIHNLQFPLGELSCYGLDFQRGDTLAAALAGIPEGCHVLFTHQGWQEWLGFYGAFQGSFKQVPAPINMLISGDNHKHIPGHFTQGQDGQPLICISPGSACMTSIAEDPDKYFLILDDDGDVSREQFKTRRVLRLGRIDTATGMDKLLAELPGQLDALVEAAVADGLPDEVCRPYVHISFYHRVADLPRRVRNLVKDRAYLFLDELRPVDDGSPRASVLVPIGVAITPLTCLDAEIDPAEHPQANALLRRLLSTADAQREFEQWQKEFPDD